MGYSAYQPEQAKVVTNTHQLFGALEALRSQARHVEGSMHWKGIAGREYLYRAYSHGKNHSLGSRSAETESLKVSFDERKATPKLICIKPLPSLNLRKSYVLGPTSQTAYRDSDLFGYT